MKNLAVLLNILLVSTFYIYPQNVWHWQMPYPTAGNYNSVAYISQNQYIAVGDFGSILKSTDGGDNWQVIEPLTSKDINKIEFISELIGFAVGDSGLILKTTDGGNTWLNRSLPMVDELFDLQVIDLNTAWIGGENGFVRRSTNGGNSWTSINTGYSFNVFIVDFTDVSNGIIFGENGAGRRTTDGGITWMQISLPGFSNYIDIYRLTPNAAWVVREDGKIAKTTDNINWTLITTGITTPLKGIWFESILLGWAVGAEGRILKTSDGGDTWTNVESGTTKNLNSICIDGPQGGLIVGNFGKVLKYDRLTSTWSGNEYISNTLNDIYFVDDNIGWAVGNLGVILKTTNKGFTWTRQTNNFTDDLLSVFMIDSSYGWIGAADGALMKTTNSGLNWTSEFSGAIYNIRKIQFFNHSTGYLLSGSTLFRTTDSGLNWSPIRTFNISTNSFFFKDANNGWVVGSLGTAFKTTNGGNTWVDIHCYDYTHRAVYFHDENRGFIASQYGQLYKTTNGGINWQVVLSTGVNASLTDISFYNEYVGIVVSEAGLIYETHDGGLTWSQNVSYTNKNLNAAVSRMNNFWVAGQDGTILYSANPIVPVNLSSFSAVRKINGVELLWTTSTELNNHYFLVDRRDEGTDWKNLGKVVGSTNSVTPKSYTYLDKNESSVKIMYRLLQVDFDGTTKILGTTEFLSELPNDFILFQNYPNPFNPSTTINFNLPEQSFVTLDIYSLQGEKITTLIKEELNSGNHNYTFDAKNLPSGTYFYRLMTETGSHYKKMILMK